MIGVLNLEINYFIGIFNVVRHDCKLIDHDDSCHHHDYNLDFAVVHNNYFDLSHLNYDNYHFFVDFADFHNLDNFHLVCFHHLK